MTVGIGGVISLFIMPLAGVVTGRLVQPKRLILTALAGTGRPLYAASHIDLDVSFWDISLLRVMQARC